MKEPPMKRAVDLGSGIYSDEAPVAVQAPRKPVALWYVELVLTDEQAARLNAMAPPPEITPEQEDFLQTVFEDAVQNMDDFYERCVTLQGV